MGSLEVESPNHALSDQAFPDSDDSDDNDDDDISKPQGYLGTLSDLAKVTYVVNGPSTGEMGFHDH